MRAASSPLGDGALHPHRNKQIAPSIHSARGAKPRQLQVAEIAELHVTHQHGLWWDCVVDSGELISLRDDGQLRGGTRCSYKFDPATENVLRKALDQKDPVSRELLMHRFLRLWPLSARLPLQHSTRPSYSLRSSPSSLALSGLSSGSARPASPQTRCSTWWPSS